MIQLAFVISSLIVIHGAYTSTELNENQEETTTADITNWDILIFTQHWPITACYQWQKKSPKNKCKLPPLNDIWTIHGIWPNKLGEKTLGPFNCNSSWHFDAKQIQPLEKQLEIYWTNIESNTPLTSFWKHEWMKHGTCAAELPELDSELKYFSKGLSWIDKYNMKAILNKHDINPDLANGYYPKDIYNAVKNITQKLPILECYKDKHLNASLISEIRICFNKSLELIDCDVAREPARHIDNKDIITNCKLDEMILYTNVVPNPPTVTTPVKDIFEYENFERAKREFLYTIIDIYRFLNFLRWLTL